MATVLDEHVERNAVGEQSVSLSSITIDMTLQPRTGGLDSAHVHALEEAVESWSPLVVVAHSGRLVLVDGFHRLAAAQNLDRASHSS